MLLPNTLYDSASAKQLFGGGDRFPVLVLTVASIVEPFLSFQNRDCVSPVEILGFLLSCLVHRESGFGVS